MSVIVNLPAPANPPVPAFDVSETLDGVQCVLHFQWNETDGSWYLRVLGQDATLPALMGDTRLVVDWPLYLSRIQALRTPPGVFLLQDTSGQGVNPGLGDLGAGARCQLIYMPAAEAAALGLT